MKRSEFIVKVLLDHPFDGDTDPDIVEAKKQIKKHYRQIRTQMPFTKAEILAKSSWLHSYITDNKIFKIEH